MRNVALIALFLPITAFAECAPGTPEPFETFIESFARDKQFALSRTHHPISLQRHNDDDETVNKNGNDAASTTGISKAEDEAQPAMNAYARKHGLQLSTSSLRDREAIVRMEKPDTD